MSNILLSYSMLKVLKSIGDIENLYCILFFYFFFHLYCCLQSYIWPVMLTYGPKKAIQYMPHSYNAHYWNSLPSWSCLSNSTFFVAVTNKLTFSCIFGSLTVDQPWMMQLCNVNKTFLCNYKKKVHVSKKVAVWFDRLCHQYVPTVKALQNMWCYCEKN